MADEGRTPRAMGQLSANDPSAPDAAERRNAPSVRRATQAVPVGIERVIFVASQDPAFRAALLRDAERAVRARGLSLRESEWAMLRAVPIERLLAAAERIDTSPANVERRGFMRAVAAGAMAVAAAGCDDPIAITGIQPTDADVGVPVYPDATGSRPDWPDAARDVADVDDAATGDAARDMLDVGDAASDMVDLGDAAPDFPAGTGIRPDDGGE